MRTASAARNAAGYAGGAALIVVISEVWPYPDRRTDYFRLAEELRPHLEAIDGFISVERLQNSAEPDKFVSISFWRDELVSMAQFGRAPHSDGKGPRRHTPRLPNTGHKCAVGVRYC
jgi:heme-degrading monooxygenase HmoA